MAILDWYSRKLLAWRLSNTMDTAFCIACFQEAVNRFGSPDIFNSDQGAQFTSQEFVETLKQFPLQISRDGRGRVADNIFVERLWRTVKYEDVYLKDYATLPEVHAGLTAYFAFYNAERAHQSLGYRTPDVVYTTGQGGGAKIVDRFSGTSAEAPAPLTL